MKSEKYKICKTNLKGELYIVATPIGNLEDITLRAIRILKEVDMIAAEDTRHTLKLLNHLGISKPLISYHRHNEEIKTDELINKLEEGKKIALVSDAGTPVISDPGGEIVREAIKNSIKVIPVPGACAAITALVASGIDAKEFTFIGFLPQNKKNRNDKLEQIRNAEVTTILYESPHRLLKTLQDLKSIVENRQIVLARELTKIHEEYIIGTIEQIEQIVQPPKGEYVIVIDRTENTRKETMLKELNQLSLEEQYKHYERNGLDKKEIIKQIAKDRNVNKNEIYQQFIKK